MTLEQRIIRNAQGEPQEVVIPWTRFCELAEVLGLDLTAEENAQLHEALADARAPRADAFVPLDSL